MIKLLENHAIAAFEEFCSGDPFGCRILAAERTYGVNEPFASFWAQYDGSGSMTAAIGRLDDGMTISHGTSQGPPADHDELDEFVRMSMGSRGALRPAGKNEAAGGLIMRLNRESIPVSAVYDVDLAPTPDDLYHVMEGCPGQGFDLPPFKEFYSDLNKRIRARTVLCALVRESGLPVACAALHMAGGTALLTMCATMPDHRGKGCAASAIRALSVKAAKYDIFLFCLPNMAEFYRKRGFFVVGGFCL